jgi:hypothetical protein
MATVGPDATGTAEQEQSMKTNMRKAHTGKAKPGSRANLDLIGKTITGVIAITPPGEEQREIWMLQFSDGSHVEFVSGEGRRRLRRSARSGKGVFSQRPGSLQLALNVA